MRKRAIEREARVRQELVLEFLQRELKHLDGQLRWVRDVQEQAKTNNNVAEARFWEQVFLHELKQYEETSDQINWIKPN
jgi:hypothetical protein